MTDALYTASATATGGRTGHAVTSDGALEVDLVVPSELGGDGGPGTNPEQLFAAGYSACFLSALSLMAGKRGIDTSAATTSQTSRPERARTVRSSRTTMAGASVAHTP